MRTQEDSRARVRIVVEPFPMPAGQTRCGLGRKPRQQEAAVAFRAGVEDQVELLDGLAGAEDRLVQPNPTEALEIEHERRPGHGLSLRRGRSNALIRRASRDGFSTSEKGSLVKERAARPVGREGYRQGRAGGGEQERNSVGKVGAAIERLKTPRIEFDHDRRPPDPAAHGGLRSNTRKGLGEQALARVDGGEKIAADGDPRLDPARQAGPGGKLRELIQPQMAGQGADQNLSRLHLEEWMADAVTPGGLKPRAVFAKIVHVGAGDDLRRRPGRDRLVKIGLAEEAAVDRVRAVTRVGQFGRIDDFKPPSHARRLARHALRRLGWNGGRGRMDHLRRVWRRAVRDGRKRHAVDAAAHRDGDRPGLPEEIFEIRQDRLHGALDGPGPGVVAHHRECGSVWSLWDSTRRLRRRRAAKLSPPTSSFSALALVFPSGRTVRLTRTFPAGVGATPWLRGRTSRLSTRQRSPSVEVSVRQQAATASTASVRASSRKSWTGRPFLPSRIPIVRSSTPGAARSRSADTAISSPVMSSTSNESTATSFGEASRAPSRSSTSALRTFGSPSISRMPAPAPTAVSLPRGNAAGDRPTRWASAAAPVGVTRSPAIPSSRQAKPLRSATVAGAGTGKSPCRVFTRPPPRGKSDTLYVASLSAAAMLPIATTSASESQSAISWKCTSSAGTPCSSASTPAMRARMASARSAAPSERRARAIRARMSR